MKVRVIIGAIIISIIGISALGAFREPIPVKNVSEAALAQRPDQMIRFHVLANSDSDEDQALKRAVRDAILKEVAPKLAVSKSLEESRKIVEQIRPEMEAVALEEIQAWDKNYTVRTDYGNFSFPTKSYGTLVLPAGQYEALRVVIGEGQGSNWWCVLFPALCFVDIEHSTAVQVDGKKQTDYAIKGKPKVRFYFWEKLKVIFG
ncbi:stage II sporulation protein R [Desulfosporosinus youngiae]|uniref:Stage II sporulation protein R n=1 Tax=Desulfosporosinus youngiae DSM 17734 TaxID=768710 RepID=H5Y044_9FIRM|nr:stage II sporulation protein R [Desulfosporosinus youngiae]EHQ91953.1 stage II sporulation protein R [Desulfosporosinus youngiae DSM 17734]